jgi:hypothetical protein
MPKNSSRIGPYSRPNALAKLDGRRREAKLMAETRAELIEHIGGSPNAVQRRLIERAAVLALRLAIMDARAPDGGMSEKDSKEYVCWSNAYVRTLRELGPHAAPKRDLSAAEAMALLRDKYDIGGQHDDA